MITESKVSETPTNSILFCRPKGGRVVSGYGQKETDCGNLLCGRIYDITSKDNSEKGYPDTYMIWVISSRGKFAFEVVKECFPTANLINRLASVKDFRNEIFIKTILDQRGGSNPATNLPVREGSETEPILSRKFPLKGEVEGLDYSGHLAPDVPYQIDAAGNIVKKNGYDQRDWSIAIRFFDNVVEKGLRPRIIEAAKDLVLENPEKKENQPIEEYSTLEDLPF